MSPPNRSANPSLVDRFDRHLRALALGEGPLVVAVSGGVDSVVLLDLLRRSPGAAGFQPVVAHVDHGIHPESGAASALVEDLARFHGLPCVVTRLHLGPDTSETRARTARLAWLLAQARQLGARWILTAHHADDQRETVLLRLLQGSAPAGLAGMASRARGFARPLLPFSRATLLRYARARGLVWWEDPANADSRHLRSWLRSEVMPLLAARLPELPRRLTGVGRHAARGRRAWAEALHHWPGLTPGDDQATPSLDWATLAGLPRPLREALAQAWLRGAGCHGGPARLRRALETLEGAASGAAADLGGGWRLELAFGRLRLRSLPAAAGLRQPVVISTGQGGATWGSWEVAWSTEPAPARQARDGATAWFIPEALALRPWRAGDRLAPLGGRGRRLAVRCFQDARIPASERGEWPLIEAGGALAWIPGVCRGNVLVPPEGVSAVRIDVRRR